MHCHIGTTALRIHRSTNVAMHGLTPPDCRAEPGRGWVERSGVLAAASEVALGKEPADFSGSASPTVALEGRRQAKRSQPTGDPADQG